MQVSVGMIHHSVVPIPHLETVAREVIGDVSFVNMVDESIPYLLLESGLTEQVVRRVCHMSANAEKAGAKAILLVSSSIGGTQDAVQAAVNVPVVRLDFGMVAKAVKHGQSIGVLSSTSIIADPIAALVRKTALEAGKKVVVNQLISQDLYDLYYNENIKGFEELACDEVLKMKGNDIVLLGDLMLYTIAETASKKLNVPVLSSFEPGFQHFARQINYFRR